MENNEVEGKELKNFSWNFTQRPKLPLSGDFSDLFPVKNNRKCFQTVEGNGEWQKVTRNNRKWGALATVIYNILREISEGISLLLIPHKIQI